MLQLLYLRGEITGNLNFPLYIFAHFHMHSMLLKYNFHNLKGLFQKSEYPLSKRARSTFVDKDGNLTCPYSNEAQRLIGKRFCIFSFFKGNLKTPAAHLGLRLLQFSYMVLSGVQDGPWQRGDSNKHLAVVCPKQGMTKSSWILIKCPRGPQPVPVIKERDDIEGSYSLSHQVTVLRS